MIASTFSSGTSYGAAVEEYLLGKKRSVQPKLMRGDPRLIVDLIDSIKRKWKYTSGVLRFHRDDKPTPQQLQDIMDSFEEFMFAGKARDTFEILWVEHLDKEDQELHYVVPRLDLETLQDLNIAPPGYADQHKVWVERINTTYGFKSPLTARPTSKPKQEAHSRATKRAAVYKQMTQKYEAGDIRSRADLIAALNEIGEVRSSRLNTKHIAVKFDGLEKRIRFDGGIFARDFDFEADRPGNTDRASRTLEDYEGTPKCERDLHRFEQPIADPLGDQDVYLKDIAERYEAAFDYRRQRFEQIRARSRRLEQLQDRPAPPPRVRPQPQETTEDVQRIRAARRRTRDRKSRLAELNRKATNAALACGRALEKIGNHLRRALERCRQALKRRASPEDFEEDRERWRASLLKESGIAVWQEALRKAVQQAQDPPPDHLAAVYVRQAKGLIDQKDRLMSRVEKALQTMPLDHDVSLRDEMAERIDQAIQTAKNTHPKLNIEQPEAPAQRTKTPPETPELKM